jgi:hypothetical protein
MFQFVARINVKASVKYRHEVSVEYNIVVLFETVGAQACAVFVMYFRKPVTFVLLVGDPALLFRG